MPEEKIEWTPEPLPPPVEAVDPEFGKLLKDFCNRIEVPRVGRNELCPCGSGRKYKKCHGKIS